MSLSKPTWVTAIDGLKTKRDGLQKQLHFYKVLTTLAIRVLSADPETVSGDIQMDFGSWTDAQDGRWRVARSGAVVVNAKIVYFDEDVAEPWPLKPAAEEGEETDE